LGGRLVSVLTGGLTLWGIYKLSKEYFSYKIALLSSFLYILSPLFLFFDRQALMESALAAVGVWSLYFLKKLVDTDGYLYALVLGIIWGIGLWLKLTGLIFIASSIIIVFLSLKTRKPKLLGKIGLSLISAFIILLPLIFQKDFGNIFLMNSRYSFSFSEMIKFPIRQWLTNFKSFLDIAFFQSFGLLIIPLILGVCHLIKNKKNLMFAVWFLLGIGAYFLTVRAANSRYLVAFLPLGIILASEYLLSLKLKFSLPLFISTVIWFILLDIFLIFKPINYFNLLSNYSAYSQKEVYLGTFTSGYGVKEAVNYIIGKANGEKTIVGVRLDAGNPEDAVYLYLSKVKNIKVIYLGINMIKNSENIKFITSNYPIYFITRENQLAGMDKFLIEKARFIKPDNLSAVVVYEIKTLSN
jgi:4-amino-4-deoxy-L-arabinose transferase-like glycosyltransferase